MGEQVSLEFISHWHGPPPLHPFPSYKPGNLSHAPPAE